MNKQKQIDIIIECVKRCTTFEQLKVLSRFHGGIPQIRMAINERACELNQ